MKLVDFLVYFTVITAWVMGMAVAISKGTWFIVGAFFPPYAWVLVAQHFMNL